MHPMLIDVHRELVKIFDAAGEKYRIPQMTHEDKMRIVKEMQERMKEEIENEDK